MADARLKQVLDYLIDIHSEPHFLLQAAGTSMTDEVESGDVLDLPNVDALTVIADGDTDTAGQTVITNVDNLNVNLNPWINARLPQRSQKQLLKGNWAKNVASTGFTNLRNSLDSSLCEHIVAQAWETGTATNYHVNEAGDSLAVADFNNAQSILGDLQGVTESNMVYLMSSYGLNSARSISGWQPNGVQAERGALGIPMVGTINNIPAYSSSQVPRRRTITSTAWDISTNVLTITVGAGHGLAAGQLITFNTVTAGGDMATATAITSTTATVITVAWTAADASATEAGTITCNDSENLLVATNHVFYALQLMPTARLVADPDSTGDHLQISTIWGRVARSNYSAVVLHSPGASI